MKYVIFLIFLALSFPVHALNIDPIMGVTDDKTCMKLNIYHEGRGESLKGMLEIIKVMVARTKSREFPSTVCDVVWQQTPVAQFEWTNDKYPDFTIRDMKTWKMIDKIVDMFYDGQIHMKIDNSVLFYHAGERTRFFKTLKFSHKIGNHLFYKERK
jgi:spore germination cell wall hydrolase CwlJ-like protein